MPAQGDTNPFFGRLRVGPRTPLRGCNFRPRPKQQARSHKTGTILLLVPTRPTPRTMSQRTRSAPMQFITYSLIASIALTFSPIAVRADGARGREAQLVSSAISSIPVSGYGPPARRALNECQKCCREFCQESKEATPCQANVFSGTDVCAAKNVRAENGDPCDCLCFWEYNDQDKCPKDANDMADCTGTESIFSVLHVCKFQFDIKAEMVDISCAPE